MELRTLVLLCILFSSIAAFTLEHGVKQFNNSDSLDLLSLSDDCQCKNGRCAKDNRGKTKCICKRGYSLQDENTCELCNCGDNGKCIFVGLSKSTGGYSYVKKCICDQGSAEKDGVCVDCRCGENSKCEFEDGEKVCYCIEGYAEKNGVCTKCDCGPDGQCTFMDGNKICTCDEDYEVIDGYCTHKCTNFKCQNGGECQSENGIPVCDCTERYSGNKCEIDKCDSLDCKNGGICDIVEGFAACKCPERYTGRDCEIDKCNFLNCLNGGKCTIKGGNAVCKCPDKFEGEDCEIDKCDYRSCQNGYKCVIQNSKPVCDCNLLEVSKYTGEDCEKATCSSHFPCQNGGHCQDGVCICLPGTSGGFCEIINDCPYLCPSRSDINCTYDIRSKRAYCDCLDINMGFYLEAFDCKRTCEPSECKNGGNCEYEELGLSRFCNCLPGTTGDFCEDVPDCQSIFCGTEANCQYDVDMKSAVCQCRDKELVFDPNDRTCKKPCRDSTDCLNGGTCFKTGSLGHCICLDGTKGDFCEEVPGCINKECGHNAKCEYDVYRRIASCKCIDENFQFDPIDFICKKQCRDSYDCKNGGTCLGDDSGMFCRCLDGTTGDFCGDVPGCHNKDCGKDAECVFDIGIISPSCKCFDENLAFHDLSKVCKKQCHDSSDCKNGGSCSDDEYKKFCRCLNGTTGDFCEEVPGCYNKYCGKEAECVFDIKKGSESCKCFDENLAFDEISKVCKKQCRDSSDCKNGGSCSDDESNKFCRCLNGTGGDFCEDVPGCYNKDCGKDAECVFDIKKESESCRCFDQDLSFDKLGKVCKKQCRDSSNCKNGGSCSDDEYNKFCRCLDGTTGDFCEEIPACYNKDCGKEAECVFDVEKRSGSCKCFDQNLAFDDVGKVCKKQCRDSSDCKNGGSCSNDEYNKFCRCLDGTTGDFCEEIPVCYNKDCGKEAECVFDIEKGSGKCKCFDQNLTFDELGKVCKRTCSDNSDCRNGGLCLARVQSWFCHCLEGTSGDFCENVTICNKMCGNSQGVVCKYDFHQKIAECLCNDEKYEFDAATKTCKRCDCGGKEIDCHVQGGKKTCVCPEGYVDEYGKCKKIHCTDRKCLDGKCDVVNDQEVCTCYEGFFLDGDECKRKECKKTPCFNGTCVVRTGGFETCVCQAGYSYRNGYCIRGACQPSTCFGGRCVIIDGELTCECPERYGLEGVGCFETQCKVKRCFGGKCDVIKTKGQPDKEICTCHEGYTLINDVCKLMLCEKKRCFGGTCRITDGVEECVCPEGHSVVQDVCVKNGVQFRSGMTEYLKI